jgi:hypothetical protein
MTYRRRRSSAESHPTWYARMLRLEHTHPGGILCFLLLEGSFAIAALMALAEFVNWWAVILLPLTVAIFVKINDVIAGVFSRPDLYRRGRTTVLRPVIWARGVASVPTAVGVAGTEPAAPGSAVAGTAVAGTAVAGTAEWVPRRAPSAMYGVSRARRNDDASVGAPAVNRPASAVNRSVPVADRSVPVVTRQVSHRRATNQRRFITATALRQPGGVTR